MTRLEAALRGIASELNRLGRSWAVVGGLAVSARTEPRFTRDIDLALAATDDSDAETLVRALVARGYAVLASLEQEAVKRLATVRLQAPGEDAAGVVVDLLFASSGVEAEVVRAADVLEVLPGVPVRVARGGHLLALKVLSNGPARPQDLMDIQGAPPRRSHRGRPARRQICRRPHRGSGLRSGPGLAGVARRAPEGRRRMRLRPCGYGEVGITALMQTTPICGHPVRGPSLVGYEEG